MHTQPFVQHGKPLEEANQVWILLHGRGASSADIVPLGGVLATRDACLLAPEATGNTWYPYSFLAPIDQNEPWLSSAVQAVRACIDAAIQHVPIGHVYLVGFSQGACLSLEVTARYPAAYGGIIAFTGGLIGEQLELERYTGFFAGSRVFICNSDRDPHVPLERSLASAKVLEKMGARVRHDTYPGMSHTITQEAVQAAKQWMLLPA